MTVFDVIEKIERAQKELARAEDIPLADQNDYLIDILEDYIRMLRDLKVVG